MHDAANPADAASPAETTPYDRMGGAEAVRTLVNAFYDLMDEDPDYFAIRKLHPPSLAGSREKLFLFLSGWLGGPPLYMEAYGHPRLRARHLPFVIGLRERDQWLSCMARAMQDTSVEPPLQEALKTAFFQTADWMRNTTG